MSFNFFKSPLVRPANVRIATIQDEDKLFRLLHRLHDDNPNPGNIPTSDARVWAHINSCCRGLSGIAGVIDTPDGKDICASIGIFPINPWYSETWFLSQFWLYIDSPYRKGGRLYKDLIQFARWHRADMSVRSGYNMALENSFITKDDIMPRLRLWRKTGQCIGALFWMTE